ncbi:hypothetical protein [Aliarcobacter butzleri]|uniref:hypothetical protein n=1 Tax=Aliarcobacter butzleri TaxID=28197 RepID=UPI0021B485A6|nr:hypothetical protein [Aliarcobacter butzleri]MCG3717672.1 hypothetical protein [Aliarcobacter butzleri]MCT7614050.1 hypothetical protein [Aliarcobacter butzleri]
MHKKTLIPYSIGDYNQILEDFQIEKIRSMEKDGLINELKDSNSWIYNCYLKNECINLFKKTGGFLNFGLTTDDLYRVGVETTIHQLNKKYFFDLNSDCHLLILKKTKSRIVNNMRNFFSSTRKVNYQQFQNKIIQIDDSYEIFDQIIFELDLKKLDKKSLQNALKNVWEDALFDLCFDINDFENLCREFNYLPLDVLIYDPYILPQMTKEACNNGSCQLVLVFEEIA